MCEYVSPNQTYQKVAEDHLHGFIFEVHNSIKKKKKS